MVDFRDGALSLHGRRLVLHDIHAFGQFRKDLLDMVGIHHTRRILTRFGYFMGQADAAAMKRLFEWESTEELIKAGVRMHSLLGIAENNLRELRISDDGRELQALIEWKNSGEAEEHLSALGPTDHAVCWMVAGYFSGFASHCTGHEIFFIEEACCAKGDPVCVARGKDRAAWGRQLDPYSRYYQVESVIGKILELSRKVQAGNRELQRQKRQIEALQRSSLAPRVEVRSKAYAEVLDVAEGVAPFDTTVLISGESGVGKEVLARYIHTSSHRAKGPFVAINCAALPDNLLESELFGHRAGAFTGAAQDRIGIFEDASGGTLLLDEIGEISVAMQVRLLRVLQEREIIRVGENRPRKIDVRIISATSRDLGSDVRAGRFREDLLYRLRVLEIAVPPLRERTEDIVPLARHFLSKIAKRMGRTRIKIDASCWDALVAYPWPGNIRELENVIERAVVFAKGGDIMPECLPSTVLHPETSASPLNRQGQKTLAEVEAEHIQLVLREANDNRLLAARKLGISPSTLWRKLKPPATPG